MVSRRSGAFFVVLLVWFLMVALVAPVPSSAATRAGKKLPRKLGCDLLKKQPSGKTTCVTMAVEAWYHTVTSGSDAPPITGAPTFSPYAEKTMHIGASAGHEDARTYLTLDLSALPIGATVAGGTLVLTLEEQESRAPNDVDMQGCYVAEPPEKSHEGSFDTPPEPDCSVKSEAVYHKKPRPLFTVDLAPFSTFLAGGAGGIVLLPTDKTSEQGASWHVALYAKKNKSKDAVAIAALLEYEKVDFGLPASGTPGVGAGGVDLAGPGGDLPGPGGGADFQTPTTGSSDFSFGGPSGIGDAALPDASSATQPVDVGSDVAAPAVAVRPRYVAIWYLPLLLLVGTAYFGFVLTRKIEVTL